MKITTADKLQQLRKLLGELGVQSVHSEGAALQELAILVDRQDISNAFVLTIRTHAYGPPVIETAIRVNWQLTQATRQEVAIAEIVEQRKGEIR